MKRSLLITAFIVILVLAAVTLTISLTSSSEVMGTQADEEASDVPFWKTSIIYQAYPRSISDELPDGTGDLVGITSKVDYLRDLGVGVVWLSPIYESPMKDFGYDISNYTAIDPIFGDMDDFDELVARFHEHGLKVVMDFVPNHSSDQHEWFQKSVRREEPYTDYYVWADPKGTDDDGSPIPPNNWLSVFRGSAWQWNEERGQFFFHQFLASQPDLNFRTPAVREDMQKILTFWLDKGVDGFRVDAITFLFEVKDLTLNEPEVPGSEDPDDYASLNHIYTTGLPETFPVIRDWRVLLDQYPDKLLMLEVYSNNMETLMKYYGNETYPLGDFPFNFLLIDHLKNRSELTGESLRTTVGLWLDNLPKGKWPNWVLGNHDVGRVASRVGEDLVDALNMVILLLPGTPVTYYGEEIGMLDTFISWEDTQDPQGCHWGPDHYQEHSRDPARTPMQWDESKFAGFTTANSTWLPVNPNYKTLNVAAQILAQTSHLKIYRELAVLRREEVFMKSNVSFPVITKDIFTFMRHLESYEQYLVVVNLSQKPVEVNLLQNTTQELPQKANVVMRSITDTSENTKPGMEVPLDKLPLTAGEGMVLTLSSEV
ncbi:hypothetical protein Pcinc_035849 [Petrolisthes cinctipes]|uniref:alpha-glucosidase n=1 Tax=Petrolisthes cinctipes TaxID=88211 RepID=A0AAE1BVQ0_PETCI|nr:hypothetical protein Pcinc_035849 [Petrolisthes cinctipes]